jgi:hypothetical protein
VIGGGGWVPLALVSSMIAGGGSACEGCGWRAGLRFLLDTGLARAVLDPTPHIIYTLQITKWVWVLTKDGNMDC